MVFGTVYTRPGNPRTTAIRVVAKLLGLDVEYKTVEGAADCGPEYLALNPLGKVPTLVRDDGFVLTECIAISIYLTQQNPESTLLGSSKEEYATVLRWMSFINTDVYDVLGGWFLPLIGRRPYNKESVEKHIVLVEQRLRTIDDQLAKTRYLAGDKLTLADVFGTGMLAGGFQCFFDKKWRAKHPNLTRWAKEVYEQPMYQAVSPGELAMVETAIPNEPVKDPSKFAR